MREAQERNRQGIPVPDRSWKLGEWLDCWLEHVVGLNRRPATYRLYEMRVRLYLKPGLGGSSLPRLSASRVQAFFTGQLAAGRSIRTVQVMRTAKPTATPSAASAKHSDTATSCPRPIRQTTNLQPTNQAANRCQTWVSTARLILDTGVFWLVRLAGFEPATRCLEGTSRGSPDAARCGSMGGLAALLVAVSGTVSPSVCGWWLPDWLPEP
jgi:hypothetical protein